jgi:hypothetical protein
MTDLDWEVGGTTASVYLEGAQSYCSAKGDGWRLPTLVELKTLCGGPWVYPTGVAGTTTDVDTFYDFQIYFGSFYWSSSPNYPCCHWAMAVVGCEDVSHTCCPNPSSDAPEQAHVRCVRTASPQCGDSICDKGDVVDCSADCN